MLRHHAQPAGGAHQLLRVAARHLPPPAAAAAGRARPPPNGCARCATGTAPSQWEAETRRPRPPAEGVPANPVSLGVLFPPPSCPAPRKRRTRAPQPRPQVPGSATPSRGPRGHEERLCREPAAAAAAPARASDPARPRRSRPAQRERQERRPAIGCPARAVAEGSFDWPARAGCSLIGCGGGGRFVTG